MKDPTYRIPSDHPAAPIADWLITLLQAYSGCRLEDLLFTNSITYKDLLHRLTCLRPSPDAPDFSRILTAHFRDRLCDIDLLLTTFRQLSDIAAQDPSFPWTTSPLAVPSTDPADFELPWEVREAMRFADGTYRSVPWAEKLPAIPGHHVHISLGHDGLVAYTETPAKGASDIQTPTKPARYLKRFYPNLADHEARDLAAAVRPVDALKFAVTADEIEHVYVAGPTSCMSKDESDYESHCHPVRVYGDSDIQLAYITNAADTPIARALVWPEKKRHGRIYGVETRLAPALGHAGYSRGELTGARIRRIREDEGVLVMPYIDDARSFDVIDEHWLVIGGPHAASTTEGLASLVATTSCARCEHCTPLDDLCDVDGERWCADCTDNYSFISANSGQRFSDEEQREVIIARRKGDCISAIWTENERDAHAFYCDATDDWYAHAAFEAVTCGNGDVWVDWYFEAHAEEADAAPPEAPSAEAPAISAAA